MARIAFLVVIIFLAASTFQETAAYATDFHGATVTDREVPSIAWRAGIVGFKPTVVDVYFDSPAAKHGFKQGNIILSVNGKNVKNSSELSQFTTDTLTVEIFNHSERKTLIIDRLAIETEKANRIAAQKTVTVPQQKIYVEEPQDDSPPLAFDDNTLEQKFGKNAGYAIPVKINTTTATTGKKNTSVIYNLSDVYGGKSLKVWSQEYRVLARVVSTLYQKMKSNDRELDELKTMYARVNFGEPNRYPNERIHREESNAKSNKRQDELNKSNSETLVEYKIAVARVKKYVDEGAKAGIPDSFLVAQLFEYDPLNFFSRQPGGPD